MSQDADSYALTPHITRVDVGARSAMAETLRQAFEDALAGRGNMDERIIHIRGFCGRKHRLFVNNLVRGTDGPRYLEVGVFFGATLCAAIAGNEVTALGVDNWSEYGGDSQGFYNNLNEIKGPGASVSIIEQDFRTINFAQIGKFNIYFYDGPHSPKDQYDGIRMAIPALDDQAILLIDDWNWQRVRDGAMSAVSDAGYKFDFCIEVRTSFDDHIPEMAYAHSDWHNGVFASVISRI